jgi:PAS domain S-box-containing protein
VRVGIAYRISLVVLVAMLGLGATLGAFFFAEQGRTLQRDLYRRVDLLGATLAGNLGRAVVQGDPRAIDAALAGAVSDPEVAYVLVKSRDGEILAGRWMTSTRSGVVERSYPLGAPPAGDERFAEVEEAATVAPIGELAVGVDLAPLRARQRALLLRTVAAVLATALLAAAAGVALVRLLLRRSLAPVLEGIRALEGGDLSRRIGDRATRDELGVIARAIDDTAARLEATLVTKGQLEEAVARRTTELTLALADLRRSQETLSEREARIRLLLDSAAEAIYGIGTDGLCTFANTAAARMLGYGSAEELVGRNMHDLVHHSTPSGAPMPERECGIYRTLREGKGYHSAEERLWRADGSSFPVELWSHPMLHGGAIAGAVVTFLDLTDRRRLEEEVLKTRKLESLGLLAGGIAHDFNNLLMGILGNLSLARETRDDPAELAELLQEAEKATLRTRALTQQLLTFSKGGAPVKKVVALRPIVEEASRFALSGSAVRGEHAFAPDLWPVEADAGQVGQVIHNLVLNAVQAMARGGVVRLSTENVTLSGEEGIPLAAGPYVRLRIADDGPGIAPEHLPRIFDPYFTTKAGGHGLGLASVFSIVKGHGGHVTVASIPGKGTTFDVYLPASPSAATAAARPAVAASTSAAAPEAARRRILVMDDEAQVRRVAAAMLGRLGFEVATAANGREAVARAREAHDAGRPYELFLLDLTVPGGFGGVDAVREIHAFDPPAVCIATSGYANDPVLARFREYGFAATVAKPYTLDDLGQAMAAAGARAVGVA